MSSSLPAIETAVSRVVLARLAIAVFGDTQAEFCSGAPRDPKPSDEVGLVVGLLRGSACDLWLKWAHAGLMIRHQCQIVWQIEH